MQTPMAGMAALATLVLWNTGALAQGQGEPAATIQTIYQAYIKAGTNAAASPNQYTRAWYSKAIGARMDRLEKACKKRDDLCMPDADFLIEGQDFEIKALQVKETARTGDKATVVARFRNFNTPSQMTFTLVNEGGRWVVDEMVSTKGGRLSRMLKPNPPSR